MSHSSWGEIACHVFSLCGRNSQILEGIFTCAYVDPDQMFALSFSLISHRFQKGVMT